MASRNRRFDLDPKKPMPTHVETGIKIAAKRYADWMERQGISNRVLSEAYKNANYPMGEAQIEKHKKGLAMPSKQMRELIEVATDGDVPAWLWMEQSDVQRHMTLVSLTDRLRLATKRAAWRKWDETRRKKQAKAARSASGRA